MARPRKHVHEKRSKKLESRVTFAELAFVQAQADACGLSVSEYTRRRTLGHVVAPLSQQTFDPTLVNEINRIGVNVQQLTQAIHMNSDFVEYWCGISTKLDELLSFVVDGSTQPTITPIVIGEIKRVGITLNKLTLAVHTHREFAKVWREVGHEVEVAVQMVEKIHAP